MPSPLALRLLAPLLLLAGPAAAAVSDWVVTPAAEARLVAAEEGVAPGAGRLSAGLQIRLEEGWKTYWRSPGEVGLAPAIDWSGSENLAGAEILWPAPQRFTAFDIENYGYDREVVLPLEIALERPGEPARLRATVSALVCADLCIPATFDLALDIPAGARGVDPEAAALIARWSARAPATAPLGEPAAGLDLDAAGLGEGAVTVAARSLDAPFDAPDVFLEGPPGLTFGKPEIRRGPGGALWARTPVTGGEARPGDPLRVTLVDGARAATFDATLDAAAPRPPAAGAAADASLLWALGVALLGGLILNAMPCVLPVLSLKLHAAVAARSLPTRRLRASFLATAAGVIVSMWAIAAGVVLARQAGLAVGWGLQFQSPLFLSFMAAVTTLFAANLAGLFEVPLPARLATRAAGAAGGHGLGGAFGAGALATLLATPCSAPFVGTAVAYALSGESWRIAAIFTALGAGLATPYLLVAAAPALARALPRPGPWMLRLRRALAVPLLATTLWLLSVLAASASPRAALLVGLALALLLTLLALGPRALRAPGAAALVLAALAAPALTGREAPAARAEAAESVWAPFDRAAIPGLVAEGRTVFVDVTADWCLTCRANETLVLDRDPVAARLAGEGVVAMKADWTRPDPAIADYLAAHGRYGIPFNVVYGPGAPEGLVLSEILTPDAVLDAFDAAAGLDLARR